MSTEVLDLSYAVWETAFSQFTPAPTLHHVYGGTSGSYAWVRAYFGYDNVIYTSQILTGSASDVDWIATYRPSSTERTTDDDARALIISETIGTPVSLIGFRNNSVTDVTKGVTQGQTQSLTSTNRVIVRNTTYTQTATVRVRSIRSDNANDDGSPGGTGARTVRITYLKNDFTGPFTEDVTLNGTSWVDTASTTMMYIESIEVLTVGSTGANAGIITLNDNTAGTGATMCTMVAGDKRIFYCHHFVATGKTMTLMGLSGGCDGVAGRISVQWSPLDVSDAALREICGMRIPAAQQNQHRSLEAPINIPGPALVAAYVKPASATAVIFWAELDYYER